MQRILASSVLFLYRVFHIVNRAAEVMVQGIWLGLLPESILDCVSEQSYGSGSEYTDDAYLDRGLQFWEEIAVSEFFKRGATVLVGAAGGGREVIALSRAGYRVLGFECCRAMVAAGNLALRRRNIPSSIEWSAPCSVPRLGSQAQAGIVGWNGYTYIVPRARRIEFLKTLTRHLDPGSPILISAAMRSGTSTGASWLYKTANAARMLTLRPAVFECGDAFPGRPRHEFTWHQVDSELAEAGLLKVAQYRWGPFFALVCRT